MWDNVIFFSFDEIYPISFVNKLNFINYIIRNNSHVIHALQTFKMQIPLGMN
jgi:hypothetical protein